MPKLQVQMVLEILGRPPEHVTESLNSLVAKIGSEKGINILEETYHDPMPAKGSNSLHTAFAEITAELDSFSDYFAILFSYMPSHIEIIDPEKFNLTNIDLNEMAGRLVQRLHDYDAITKKSIYERNMILETVYSENPELYQKIVQANTQPANPQDKKPEEKKEDSEEKPAPQKKKSKKTSKKTKKKSKKKKSKDKS